MNGGSGQWKRLRSRMGHALDDDDDGVIQRKFVRITNRILMLGDRLQISTTTNTTAIFNQFPKLQIEVRPLILNIICIILTTNKL